MRAVTNKMLISLIGIALAAPFIAIALIAGARAVALAEGTQDNVLLIALATGGAIISMINGFGRRTGRAAGKRERTSEALNNSGSKGASVITLGC